MSKGKHCHKAIYGYDHKTCHPPQRRGLRSSCACADTTISTKESSAHAPHAHAPTGKRGKMTCFQSFTASGPNLNISLACFAVTPPNRINLKFYFLLPNHGNSRTPSVSLASRTHPCLLLFKPNESEYKNRRSRPFPDLDVQVFESPLKPNTFLACEH